VIGFCDICDELPSYRSKNFGQRVSQSPFRIQTFVQVVTRSETSMPCLNGPTVHPLLAKFNQFLTLSRPSFKIYFNIVFLSTPASPK